MCQVLPHSKWINRYPIPSMTCEINPFGPGDHTVSLEPCGRIAGTATLHEKLPRQTPLGLSITTPASMTPRSRIAHAIFVSTRVAAGCGPDLGCGTSAPARKSSIEDVGGPRPLTIGAPTAAPELSTAWPVVTLLPPSGACQLHRSQKVGHV